MSSKTEIHDNEFSFQAGIRYSQSDLSSADRRGLLWLLDEEAIFPGATDESFVERLLLQYNQRGSQVLGRLL